MKRVYAAFAVLLLIAGITGLGCYAVDKVADELQERLERIQLYADQGEFPKAEAETDSLLSYYKEKEHLLAVFLKRDYTSALQIDLSTISTYLDEEHKADLRAEVDRAKAQVFLMEHLFFAVF